MNPELIPQSNFMHSTSAAPIPLELPERKCASNYKQTKNLEENVPTGSVQRLSKISKAGIKKAKPLYNLDPDDPLYLQQQKSIKQAIRCKEFRDKQSKSKDDLINENAKLKLRNQELENANIENMKRIAELEKHMNTNRQNIPCVDPQQSDNPVGGWSWPEHPIDVFYYPPIDNEYLLLGYVEEQQ